MTDQKNLLLFVGITMVILIGFEFLYVAPQRARDRLCGRMIENRGPN